MDVLLIQDGSLQNHTTEEARSPLTILYLLENSSPSSITSFGSSIRNTPKSLLKGDTTTTGKSVYHFKAFVVLTVVFCIG